MLREGEIAKRHFPYADIADALDRIGLTESITITPVGIDSVGGVYRGEGWKVSATELRQ